MAELVTQIMTPDIRSMMLSTKLEMMEREPERIAATNFPTSNS